MDDLTYQLDRLSEMSGLLVQMCEALHTDKFWELDKQFNNLIDIYNLEDSINKASAK
jgi:hypothetical protein